MMLLYDILTKLKHEFSASKNGEERGTWFIYTLVAIIFPFASSKTSNLLRCIKTVFGLTIRKKRYYCFMASPKMPWNKLWHRLWTMIPEPLTKGRLIIAAFSSWISRVQQLIDIAEKYDKYIFLSGRSMVENIAIAQKLGYLSMKP